MQRGVLRWHDLANPAGALTGLRLCIAIAFPFLVQEPRLALCAYFVAIATDILDGTVARKTHSTSHTGAVVDGWVDKVLHINGAWSMTLHGYMPAWWMLLWFSREIIQWGMFLIIVGDFRTGRVRIQHTSIGGRITAVLLFAVFVFTLSGQMALAEPLTWLTGCAGLWAGTGYLRRHLDDRSQLR